MNYEDMEPMMDTGYDAWRRFLGSERSSDVLIPRTTEGLNTLWKAKIVAQFTRVLHSLLEVSPAIPLIRRIESMRRPSTAQVNKLMSEETLDTLDLWVVDAYFRLVMMRSSAYRNKLGYKGEGLHLWMYHTMSTPTGGTPRFLRASQESCTYDVTRRLISLKVHAYNEC